MMYRVIVNLEVGNEAAAYDVVKGTVENAKCESFEIQNEQEVARQACIKSELIAHLAMHEDKEEFCATLEAIGFTEAEILDAVEAHKEVWEDPA